MPWLTPDTLPPIENFAVRIPDNEQLRAAFLGAFLELTREYNWEKAGTQEPETIAQLFFEAYKETEKLWYCTKEKAP
jgi:hypothetical protein